MNNENVMNLQELEERLDGDFDLYLELSELFFEDSSALLAKIKDAMENGDSEGLRKSAHTLKGAVSNFSVQRAYDAAYELELAGKNSELDSVNDKYNLLEKEIEEMINAMKTLASKGSF